VRALSARRQVLRKRATPRIDPPPAGGLAPVGGAERVGGLRECLGVPVEENPSSHVWPVFGQGDGAEGGVPEDMRKPARDPRGHGAPAMASVNRRNHPSQLRGQLGPPRVRVVRIGDLSRLRGSLGDGFPSYLDQSRIEEITQRARGGGRGQAGGASDRSSGAQAQRRSNQSGQDLHLGYAAVRRSGP